MKKLLLILSFLLTILNLLRSEEKSMFHNTSWNVIRELFYDGTQSKIIRYKDDVRFGLIGATQSDSTLMIHIISQLDSISEIVSMRLEPENSNFEIEFLQAGGGTIFSENRKIVGSDILKTELQITSSKGTDPQKALNIAYYHILRNLTIRQNSVINGKTRYNGLLDQELSDDSQLHEIDLDILKKIYSLQFYEDFKAHTIHHKNYIFYLQIEYHNLIKYISVFLLIILSLFLITHFLSSNRYKQKSHSLRTFLKDGFVLITGLIIALLLLAISQITHHGFYGMGNTTILLFYLILIYISGFAVLLVIYYLERWMKLRSRKLYQLELLTFAITFFSLYLVFVCIFVAINALISISTPGITISFSNTVSFLYLATAIAIVRTLFVFMKHRTQSLINQKDVELAKMTALKNQAELQALHSRINPHFLYNSLNSIAGLAETEPKKVQKMSMALSELFRYAVNKNNDHTVTVKQEMEMVRRYMEVEQVRFGDQLSFSFDVDKNTVNKTIPKFLIQPLVENAIKHGVSHITKKGILKISVLQNVKDLIITVHDNGPSFPEELVSGYGLQNLHDKLEILYKDDAEIVWANGNDKHIKITLKNQF